MFAMDESAAASLMHRYQGTVTSDWSIEQARQFMSEGYQQGLIVLDKNSSPMGFVEPYALLKALQDTKPETQVEQIMRSFPVHLSTQTPLLQCVEIMNLHSFDLLPVVQDESYQGLIFLKDATQRLAEECKSLRSDLRVLEKRLQMKDEYLGLISHDIRTPLSVIALSCDYLENSHETSPLNENQHSFVARISKNTKKAIDMSHEIMQVLRLEQNNQLNLADCKCREIVQKAIEDLELLANTKSLTFDFEAPEEVRCRLDLGRFDHILENFLTNAIKFSPENSTVTVNLATAAKGEREYLKLSIRDQGPGISDADCERIFERFTQTEEGVEKNRQTQGFGLGLAIARKFVELHGGWIELDGGLGHGAMFTIWLPGVNEAALPDQQVETLAATGASAETNAIQSEADVKSISSNVSSVEAPLPSQSVGISSEPKILLVEDDEDILEFFADELEDSGHYILTAEDGEIAYRVFLRERPDVVMSDIRMPKSDGLELLARLRLESPNTPVILCSGFYAGLSEELANSNYQPDQMLEKPVTIDEIKKAISQALDKVTSEKAS
jgi:signal transduction histidine kinase/ActR/RegA family two-component response regulator